jgi:hypothetical protein
VTGGNVLGSVSIQPRGLGLGEGIAEGWLVGARRDVDLGRNRNDAWAERDVTGQTGHC